MTRTKKLFKYTFFFLTLSGGGFFFYHNQVAQGATITWTGTAGDSLWSTGGNWSSGTKPGSGDIAYFDNTCTNCDVTIDQNVTLSGIDMDSTYTGTITHTTHTIHINGNYWYQAGGTFVGGSGQINAERFFLSGGSFQSTNGTFMIDENYQNSTTIMSFSGGTFIHNNGTFYFNTQASIWDEHIVSLSQDLIVYNVVISIGGDYNGSARVAFTGSGNIIVENNYSQNDGKVSEGDFYISGDVFISGGAGEGWKGAYNTARLRIVGEDDQYYTYSGGGSAPYLIVDKPEGTSFQPEVGTEDFRVTRFTLSSGIFEAPSDLFYVGGNVNQNWAHFYINGGEYRHNGGRIYYRPTCYYDGIFMDIATGDPLHDLTIYCNTGNYGNTGTVDLDGVVVEGDFTLSRGGLRGSVEVYGNVIADGYNNVGNNDATIHFTGPNIQTYTDLGGNEPDGDVYINKTDGYVLTNSDVQWNASGQALYLQDGKFISGSDHNVSLTGLSVSPGAEFSMVGTGDLILHANAQNDGRVVLRGNGTCGGTDDLFLRSNSTGSQRLWSGSGSYVVHDTEVRDMAGTSSITAYSSSNGGNNGANWTFSTDPCPEAPVSAEIRSGFLDVPNGFMEVK